MDSQQLLHKWLVHTERGLWKIADVVMPIAPSSDLDRGLIEQYEEQINGHRLELCDVSHCILALDGEGYVLTELESSVSQMMVIPT